MKRKSFTDEIRDAIANCGKSQYSVSKAINVHRATLSRFMRGERGLTVDVLDRLADEIDLHAVVSKRKAGKQ